MAQPQQPPAGEGDASTNGLKGAMTFSSAAAGAASATPSSVSAAQGDDTSAAASAPTAAPTDSVPQPKAQPAKKFFFAPGKPPKSSLATSSAASVNAPSGGGTSNPKGSGPSGSSRGGSSSAKPWASALTTYAKTVDPSKLPSDICLMFDDWTIVIYDKFAKSKFHFLVIPRMPFKLDKQDPSTDSRDSASDDPSANSSPREAKKPKLELQGGKLALGTSASGRVPEGHLEDVSTLLASPYAAQILGKLRATADRVSGVDAARIGDTIPTSGPPALAAHTTTPLRPPDRAGPGCRLHSLQDAGRHDQRYSVRGR